MKHFIILLLASLLFGCGSKDSDGQPEVAANSPVIEEQVFLPIERGCDVFSSLHNPYAAEFISALTGLSQKCSEDKLPQNQEDKLFAIFNQIESSFSTLDIQAHQNCTKHAKKLIKEVFAISKIDESTFKGLANKTIKKSHIDNTFRKLVRDQCISNFDEFTYSYNDEERVFQFNDNLLINGSFEYIKENNDFVVLTNNWKLIKKNQFPGWNIKTVQAADDIRCNLVEVQGPNVVTSVPNGQHIIELDSHCLNDQGQRVSGDARIEIIQSVTLKDLGSYRLSLKAQKRSGTHGDLHISAYQASRDKDFQSIPLSNQESWNEVCVDIEIDDIAKDLKVAIRDGEEGGRQTYGILIDDVKLEQGTCLEID